jgi:hypothetical protein
MGMFGGLSEAKTSQTGQYLAEGEFVLEVQKCLVTGRGKTFFIAECVVIENSNGKKNDKGELLDPVGAKRSWMQDLTDKDVGFGALKGFIQACVGLDLKDPANAEAIKKLDGEIEQIAEAAISAEQVLKGRKVRDHVFLKDSKKNPGKTYHRHVFSPAPAAA